MTLGLTLGLTLALAAASQAAAPSQPPPGPPPGGPQFDPAPGYSPNLKPEVAGAQLVQALIAGDPPAMIAPYFEESLAPRITDEAVKGLQQQLVWVSDLLGDALQVFAEGARKLPDGSREYFREYRFANETDLGHPVVLAHVTFADSLTNRAAGVFVKTFTREPGERRLADNLIWTLGARKVHVHSLGVLELEGASMLFARVENADTVSLATHESALPYAAPIAREAARQGWLDSARATARDSSKPLIDEIGVLFMRRDPQYGYLHIRHTVQKDEYARVSGEPESKNAARRKPGTKKGK